jgi:hypothetical protein
MKHVGCSARFEQLLGGLLGMETDARIRQGRVRGSLARMNSSSAALRMSTRACCFHFIEDASFLSGLEVDVVRCCTPFVEDLAAGYQDIRGDAQRTKNVAQPGHLVAPRRNFGKDDEKIKITVLVPRAWDPNRITRPPGAA